jgi:CheY-like chemotaxis protein
LRVVLIEDLREVREGLSALINGTTGFKCAAAYGMMETALARIENDKPDIILTELGLPGMSGVEGIERIQFEYGVDTDGNGSPDLYTANPATPVDWNTVVTVKISALARSLEPSPGYTDTKTYTLGNDAAGAPVTVGPFNDSYRRHVFNGVVRLINPSGRREAQ